MKILILNVRKCSGEKCAECNMLKSKQICLACKNLPKDEYPIDIRIIS